MPRMPRSAGGASTNENNDGLLPSVSPNPAPLPTAAPLPLPGADATADAASRWLPVLYSAGGLLLLGLLLASPQLARTALRRRRLNGARGDSAAALQAWAELRDLAMDYGVAPRTSETPRHFSDRLRLSGALGEPHGIDAAGHQAVRALTADFEQRQYGRPSSGGDGAGVPGSADKLRAVPLLREARGHRPLTGSKRSVPRCAPMPGRWCGSARHGCRPPSWPPGGVPPRPRSAPPAAQHSAPGAASRVPG